MIFRSWFYAVTLYRSGQQAYEKTICPTETSRFECKNVRTSRIFRSSRGFEFEWHPDELDAWTPTNLRKYPCPVHVLHFDYCFVGEIGSIDIAVEEVKFCLFSVCRVFENAKIAAKLFQDSLPSSTFISAQTVPLGNCAMRWKWHSWILGTRRLPVLKT